MTAKVADIDVAEVTCTPAELTITWQNSSYSVYSSLWLRDNAPAHRDARTGQRLISLVDLPLEPRLHSAVPWPPGHITLSWEDGETAVFPRQWLREYDRSLRLSSRPTRLPWMGQTATHFARSAYPDWVADPSIREDWLYYVGRDGLAFLSGVPIEHAAVLQVAAHSASFARPTKAPSSTIVVLLPCQSTLTILIVIRFLASCCCIASQTRAAAEKVSSSTEWLLRSGCALMTPMLFPRSVRRPSSIAFRMPPWTLPSNAPCLRWIRASNSAPSVTTIARSRRCHSRVLCSKGITRPTVSLPISSAIQRDLLSTGCSLAIWS